jgi:hypothetical protein
LNGRQRLWEAGRAAAGGPTGALACWRRQLHGVGLEHLLLLGLRDWLTRRSLWHHVMHVHAVTLQKSNILSKSY